jgi:hypothetical protein
MVKENPERKGKEGGRRERKRKGTWIVIAKTKTQTTSHRNTRNNNQKELRTLGQNG